MSEPTVWIEFDDDQRRYEPGDKIVGTVFVRTDEAYDNARVSLSREWRTSGRARPRSGGRDEILLFEGDWDSAGTHRFPFIFHVPPGPYTYQGRLIQVDWFLCAIAETDAAKSTAEERFAVDAAGDEREFIIGDTTSVGGAGAGHRSGVERVFWVLGTILLTLVGLWLLYPNIAALPGASWATLLASIGSLGLAAWSAHALYREGRDDDDNSGMIEPSDENYQVEPGDYVSFLVELQPNFKTAPKGVTAFLKGVEHVVFDDGDNTHAEVHRFHEEAVTIQPLDEGALERGQKSSFRVSLRMPGNAPFSFYCPNASVGWTVEVHVDVGSWPDWRRDFPLVVRPCVGDGRLRRAPSGPVRGELG